MANHTDEMGNNTPAKSKVARRMRNPTSPYIKGVRTVAFGKGKTSQKARNKAVAEMNRKGAANKARYEAHKKAGTLHLYKPE